MRIDQLTLRNFKKFEDQVFEFHPRFNLLVGENGSGKTTVLDASAVAASIWLMETRDSRATKSRRRILPHEIRLEPTLRGDRIQFRESHPVSVGARGEIGGAIGEWVHGISTQGRETVLSIQLNISPTCASGSVVRRPRQESGGDRCVPVLR